MTTSISGTGGVTFNDNSVQNTAATGFGFKNRIINGAMMIDQRNAGAAVTTPDVYTVDRWIQYQGGGGAITWQQSSIAPTGFNYSLSATVTTADTSLGTSDYYFLRQFIEGYNAADLGFGTANAQSVTVSFWVRSSLTGTFGGCLQNGSTNRSYPFTYAISAANTWEQKTVTVAGDTSGTWLKTNGAGLGVCFSLGFGTNFIGTANAWASSTFYTVTGATNLISTNGATFYITGVQLEKGSTATSFDYRPYGTELSLCQRYAYVPSAVYQAATASGLQYNASSGFFSLQFPVFMRTAPTLNSITASNWAVLYQGSAAIPTAITLNASAPSGASLYTSQTLGAGNPIILWPTNTSAQMIFSAEL